MKEVIGFNSIICKKGIEKKVRLRVVTILTNGRLNLLSISQMLEKGWKCQENENRIKISKDGLNNVLGIKNLTRKGLFYGTIKRNQDFCCNVGGKKVIKMSFEEAHTNQDLYQIRLQRKQ
jgi:hypothetical protein